MPLKNSVEKHYIYNPSPFWLVTGRLPVDCSTLLKCQDKYLYLNFFDFIFIFLSSDNIWASKKGTSRKESKKSLHMFLSPYNGYQPAYANTLESYQY